MSSLPARIVRVDKADIRSSTLQPNNLAELVTPVTKLECINNQNHHIALTTILPLQHIAQNLRIKLLKMDHEVSDTIVTVIDCSLYF